MIEMLHTLLPAHELDHFAERLPRLLASQQESATALEQHGNILDVCTGKIIEADFEHVQDDVWWDDFEFRQVCQERDVLST